MWSVGGGLSLSVCMIESLNFYTTHFTDMAYLMSDVLVML